MSGTCMKSLQGALNGTGVRRPFSSGTINLSGNPPPRPDPIMERFALHRLFSPISSL
jgi:hypothetical protein